VIDNVTYLVHFGYNFKVIYVIILFALSLENEFVRTNIFDFESH